MCPIWDSRECVASYAGSMRSMDVARLSVFLDYDGTISHVDTGVHLLERLGGPGWREVDAEYESGEIGSRMCLLDEWDLLPSDRDLLVATAAEVAIDFGVHALVDDLLAGGA